MVERNKQTRHSKYLVYLTLAHARPANMAKLEVSVTMVYRIYERLYLAGVEGFVRGSRELSGQTLAGNILSDQSGLSISIQGKLQQFAVIATGKKVAGM